MCVSIQFESSCHPVGFPNTVDREAQQQCCAVVMWLLHYGKNKNYRCFKTRCPGKYVDLRSLKFR
jgi:hypothetical protein